MSASTATSGSARGSSTLRTGSGRWTSIGGGPRAARISPARPGVRPTRTLGIHYVAELAEQGGASARAPGPVFEKIYCAGAQRHLQALPFEFRILRLGFEPWTPADILGLGKLFFRPLGQLGARAAAGRHGVGALGRSDGVRLRTLPTAGIRSRRRSAGAGMGRPVERCCFRQSSGDVCGGGGPTTGGSAAPELTGARGSPATPTCCPSMPGIWHQVLGGGGAAPPCSCMAGLPGTADGENDDVALESPSRTRLLNLFIRIEGHCYLFEGPGCRWNFARRTIAVKGAFPARVVVRATHHGRSTRRWGAIRSAAGAELDLLQMRTSASSRSSTPASGEGGWRACGSTRTWFQMPGRSRRLDWSGDGELCRCAEAEPAAARPWKRLVKV